MLAGKVLAAGRPVAGAGLTSYRVESGERMNPHNHAWRSRGPAAAAVPTYSVYLQNSVTGLNAADSGGTVAAHNPKGNEDHQQWTPVAVTGGHQLRSTDQSGICLGRGGTSAVTATCGADGTTWTVTEAANSVRSSGDVLGDEQTVTFSFHYW